MDRYRTTTDVPGLNGLIVSSNQEQTSFIIKNGKLIEMFEELKNEIANIPTVRSGLDVFYGVPNKTIENYRNEVLKVFDDHIKKLEEE